MEGGILFGRRRTGSKNIKLKETLGWQGIATGRITREVTQRGEW